MRLTYHMSTIRLDLLLRPLPKLECSTSTSFSLYLGRTLHMGSYWVNATKRHNYRHRQQGTHVRATPPDIGNNSPQHPVFSNVISGDSPANSSVYAPISGGYMNSLPPTHRAQPESRYSSDRRLPGLTGTLTMLPVRWRRAYSAACAQLPTLLVREHVSVVSLYGLRKRSVGC